MSKGRFAAGLAVLACTFAGLASEAAPGGPFIKPAKLWRGTRKAGAPGGEGRGGYLINDAATFAKYWRCWRGPEAMPTLDFKKRFAFVAWCPAGAGKNTTLPEALTLNVDFAVAPLLPLAKPNFAPAKVAKDFHYALAVYERRDLPRPRRPAGLIKRLNTPGWKHGPSVYCLSFSPDGRTLASAGSGGTIKLWDVASRKHLATLKANGATVLSVSFGPDRKTLAAAGQDRAVRLWDVRTGKNTATFWEIEAGAVLFSQDGRALAFSGTTASLWDVKAGKRLPALVEGDSAQKDCCAFSPVGKAFAAAVAGDAVQLWHVPSGKKAATLAWQGGDGGLLALAFAPDGKTLATGSDRGEVRLLDVASGKTVKLLGTHGSAVLALRFSADGQTLAVGDRDEGIRLWNVKSGAEAGRYQGNTGYGMTFSPDLRWAAAYEENGDLLLWDLSPGK